MQMQDKAGPKTGPQRSVAILQSARPILDNGYNPAKLQDVDT
jgi:hypothetical protein